MYSLCLTLRQADTANDGFDTYKNQARVEIRKIGLDRIRSMELLKQCFALLQKHFPNPNAQANAQGGANAQGSGESKDAKEDEAPKKPLLSTILKRHVTDTVLYMLKVFPFCSISHQQAILIMQSLSENYDQEDLQMLKTFVKVELDRQSRFMYPDSTNTTSGMNMGQIIQIALKIRNITQQEIDEQSSNESDPEDEEEGNGQMSMGDVSKRAEMFEWMRFCKEKIDPIDKVWQRRLEDPPSDDPDEDDEKEDITVITQPSTEEEEAKSEGLVKGILDRVPHRGRVVRKSAEEAQRLREMINTNDDDDDEKNDQEASPEDDLTPKMENAEYNQSTYWSTPEMYALDDLLEDME